MKPRIPEAEARAVLATPKTCPDPADWFPSRTQAGTYMLETGVLHADGSRSGLTVQFVMHRGAKTSKAYFRFDLFRATFSGAEPIYGIHIKQAPRALKAEHNMPHEHIGSLRVVGGADWIKWGYAEVLERFCQVASITFLPAPPDPEEFRLTP
jgi:hypothetical protein